jgi:hypothetical protein
MILWNQCLQDCKDAVIALFISDLLMSNIMEVYRRQEKYSLRKEVQGKGGILSVLKVILVHDSFPDSDIIP